MLLDAKRSKPRLLSLLTMLAIVGCGASKSVPPTTTLAQAVQTSNDPHAGGQCPLAIAGTRVETSDTPGGIEVTFLAAKDDEVQAVRDRVHAMAQAGGMGTACPCGGAMHEPGTHEHGMHGGGMAMMPAADVRVEDVPGGARLTFTAKKTSDVDALRSHVRMHVEHMRSRGCAAP